MLIVEFTPEGDAIGDKKAEKAYSIACYERAPLE